MDAQSLLLHIVDGPWPVLDPAELDALIERFFQAFQPANVDAHKLLKALSLMESSGGKNCGPRHEKAYCTGAYSKNPDVKHLTALFGHSAHCSYGPWQVLLINCLPDTRPEMMRNAEDCARATSDFLVRLNLRFHPQSVEEWGQVWNGGHVGAIGPGVDAYVAQLRHYYGSL